MMQDKALAKTVHVRRKHIDYGGEFPVIAVKRAIEDTFGWPHVFVLAKPEWDTALVLVEDAHGRRNGYDLPQTARDFACGVSRAPFSFKLVSTGRVWVG